MPLRHDLQGLLRRYREQLSRMAREGFSEQGRGAVVAVVDASGHDLRAGYYPEHQLATPGASILAQPNDTDFAALFREIREYDSDQEFVLFLEATNPAGTVRYDLCRVRLPLVS